MSLPVKKKNILDKCYFHNYFDQASFAEEQLLGRNLKSKKIKKLFVAFKVLD